MTRFFWAGVFYLLLAILVLSLLVSLLTVKSYFADQQILQKIVKAKDQELVLIVRPVDSPKKESKPNCWVPYYDTSVMGIVFMELEQVLLGYYDREDITCLDHLYQLVSSLGPAQSLKLSLTWNKKSGLYQVIDHTPVTTLKTVFWMSLPFLVALTLLGLMRLAGIKMSWRRRPIR